MARQSELADSNSVRGRKPSRTLRPNMSGPPLPTRSARYGMDLLRADCQSLAVTIPRRWPRTNSTPRLNVFRFRTSNMQIEGRLSSAGRRVRFTATRGADDKLVIVVRDDSLQQELLKEESIAADTWAEIGRAVDRAINETRVVATSGPRQEWKRIKPKPTPRPTIERPAAAL